MYLTNNASCIRESTIICRFDVDANGTTDKTVYWGFNPREWNSELVGNNKGTNFHLGGPENGSGTKSNFPWKSRRIKCSLAGVHTMLIGPRSGFSARRFLLSCNLRKIVCWESHLLICVGQSVLLPHDHSSSLVYKLSPCHTVSYVQPTIVIP